MIRAQVVACVAVLLLSGCAQEDAAPSVRGAERSTPTAASSPSASSAVPSASASASASAPTSTASGLSTYGGNLTITAAYDRPDAFVQPFPNTAVTVDCTSSCVLRGLGPADVTIMGLKEVDKGIPLIPAGPGRYRISVSRIPGDYCAQDTPARHPTEGVVTFSGKKMTLEATQPGFKDAACDSFSNKYVFAGELIRGEPVS